MHIFLDTATEDFLLLLIDSNNKVVDKYHYKNYKKKVNLIADTFSTMLQSNKLKASDINEFYTNIGPGFFTGIRSSLVFIRTIALITKKPIFTTTTFEIMNIENVQRKNLTLDAQGGKVFVWDFKKHCDTGDFGKSIEIIESNEAPMKLDHSELIKNWFFYKKYIFKKHTNVLDIKLMYIKEPQIGVKK